MSVMGQLQSAKGGGRARAFFGLRRPFFLFFLLDLRNTQHGRGHMYFLTVCRRPLCSAPHDSTKLPIHPTPVTPLGTSFPPGGGQAGGGKTGLVPHQWNWDQGRVQHRAPGGGREPRAHTQGQPGPQTPAPATTGAPWDRTPATLWGGHPRKAHVVIGKERE